MKKQDKKIDVLDFKKGEKGVFVVNVIGIVFDTKTRKILIAEDEQHIRRLIKVILGKEEHEFLEAKDGKEALDDEIVHLDLTIAKVRGHDARRVDGRVRRVGLLSLLGHELLKFQEECGRVMVSWLLT